MEDMIHFNNQWKYVICSKVANKQVTVKDMTLMLKENKKLWDKDNRLNFQATISGLMSDLSEEGALTSVKAGKANVYSRGKEFETVIRKYAYNTIDQVGLKDDGDGLVCSADDKVILTNKQLEELWNNYEVE